jgi:hypothetical protein
MRAAQITVLGHPFGQAEIRDFRRTEAVNESILIPSLFARIEEDVPGLEVTMDDTLSVSLAHGPGERCRQRGGRPRRLRLVVDALVESSSRNVFERQIGLPFEFANLMDSHDIRMMQPCDRLRLGTKSIELSSARASAREHHLERDQTLQAEMKRLVNHAHTASSDLFENFVLRRSNDEARPRKRSGRQRRNAESSPIPGLSHRLAPQPRHERVRRLGERRKGVPAFRAYLYVGLDCRGFRIVQAADKKGMEPVHRRVFALSSHADLRETDRGSRQRLSPRPLNR